MSAMRLACSMPVIRPECPQFFTATNLWWKPLLKDDAHKEIVISSLRFLVEKKRISMHAFVLMPNHIHLIWKINPDHRPENVQRDFLKFTGQQIKFNLQKNDPGFLERFRVDDKDRQYQLWERNPYSKALWTAPVYLQKLQYIHDNPVKKGFCKDPEDYHYSSALFYETGIDNWGFLERYDLRE